jgi:hypothetical protein
MINRTYEVNFDNGHTIKTHSLSDARAMKTRNMYDAKVTSIYSTYLDARSNEKKNKIKI